MPLKRCILGKQNKTTDKHKNKQKLKVSFQEQKGQEEDEGWFCVSFHHQFHQQISKTQTSIK